MALHLRTELVGSLSVLSLEGDVDLSTLPRWRDALLQHVDAAPGRRVALDLDHLESLDDAGLGIVLGAAARARERGGELVLVCSGDRLRARISITRLDRAVPTFPTTTAAATAAPT